MQSMTAWGSSMPFIIRNSRELSSMEEPKPPWSTTGLGVGGVPLQGGQHGVVDGGEHCPFRAELYLGLGGVDVYVHRV